ncbi:MAG: phosphate signaling complex protein PhoU [Mariprofundales bacterium]|nr:phosphate signaling complex protein PhoU [Mariprofundales bacterium]
MNAHTFTQFDEDLDYLHAEILKMLKLTRRNTKNAINALLNGDKEKAENVIAADQIVNALELHIDQAARLLIVHHQPVASDLRAVFSALKMTTELERISDLAACIAKVTREIDLTTSTSELAIMKPLLLNMFRLTRESIKQRDPGLAAQVISYDIHLNNSYSAVQRVMHSMMMENPSQTTQCIALTNVAKRIERAGDHLKNIAQMVIYMTSGQEVRHIDADQLAALLAEEDDNDET